MRIGTRGSALALAQAGAVAEALGGGARSSPITTTRRPRPRGAATSRAGSRELERGAAATARSTSRCTRPRTCPASCPTGLDDRRRAGARGPARRARAARASLDELPAGRAGRHRAACAARAQLLALRADLEVVELRGNVDTRLRELADGDYDAIVLAAAGLRAARPRATRRPARCSTSSCPRAGQGALALEARAGDDAAPPRPRAITDRGAHACAARRARARRARSARLPHAGRARTPTLDDGRHA